MSNKTRRELDRLEDDLEHAEMSQEELAAAVANLPVSLKDWAAEIRAKVNVALEAERSAKNEQARAAYKADLARLHCRPVEPSKSFMAQQLVMKGLLARAPEASVAYLKFEEATAEELAEMIRSLRPLLADDES
jgi:hypothetical protein